MHYVGAPGPLGAKTYVKSISFVHNVKFLRFFSLVLDFLIGFQIHTQEENISASNRGLE